MAADSAKSASTDTSDRPSTRRPGLQVIARASKILRALEGQPTGLSLGEIAKAVDLPRSTVQRIVSALETEQFVLSATPKARVVLGPALIRLASSVKIDIVQLARPTLTSLSADTGETVDLSVLQGNNAVFVDQLPGSHRLRAVSHIGDSFPLHCTACGKALLAVSDNGLLASTADQGLEGHTQNTITKLSELKENLERFATTQLTYDNEEHAEGISAIGTAFVDPVGRAYAISIPVPTTRFGRQRASLESLLLEARNEIVQALGTTTA